jgi:hypothetical protein
MWQDGSLARRFLDAPVVKAIALAPAGGAPLRRAAGSPTQFARRSAADLVKSAVFRSSADMADTSPRCGVVCFGSVARHAFRKDQALLHDPARDTRGLVGRAFLFLFERPGGEVMADLAPEPQRRFVELRRHAAAGGTGERC